MKHIRLFVILSLSILLCCCSSDFNIEGLEEKLPYISLDDSVDFNNLTKYEFEKIFNASARIHYAEDDNGLLYIKEKSAQQICVSENIYQYFISIVNNTNDIRIKDNKTIRNSLISRGEYPGYTNIADCMAWAISMAKGLSYDYVSDVLYERYKGGVPLYATYEALLCFGNFNTASKRNFTTPETFSNGNGFIVIYRAGTKCHAVNGWYQNIDGAIYCRDYQGGGEPKVVLVLFEDIEGIYYYD